MKESLYIILNQYKKEHISEEETVKLIEDLYNKPTGTWVYPYWDKIIYQNETMPAYKYEVTCKYDS